MSRRRNKRQFVNTGLTQKLGSGFESLYVYSFPSYLEKMYQHKKGKEQSVRLKIGMTSSGDSIGRIKDQLGTSNPEQAVFMFEYRCHDSHHVESYVHQNLKKRGKHIYAPGTEWFDVKFSEVVVLIHKYDTKYGIKHEEESSGNSDHSIWVYISIAAMLFYLLLGN